MWEDGNTNKIMITGGHGNRGFLDSTEILDTEDGSVTIERPMNFKRVGHGMGVITINGEERLAVFGGSDGRTGGFDSVELYNTQTGQWENTDIKLKERNNFGFLSVKLANVASHL